ncbi:MAG: hypothetical protein EOP22_01665 [Hyphomicrobiales bacterium]|nr:MAG: hypothetical protein EOP22_01665 [Hyphomicrobiales bacterium]
MRPDASFLHFVRGLIRGGVGQREGKLFVLPDGRRADAKIIAALVRSGALQGDATQCRADATTIDWYKRLLIEGDAFQAQHRLLEQGPNDRAINLAESPLTRLATGSDAFLERHHLEAGERVRRLIERAQLQPRVTMAYSATRSGGKGQRRVADLSDMAAEARRALDDIHRVLPRDCAGVVFDICGLFKGLQEVERDRGWPRRSAKLVLRIGLEQLAQHYGLGPFAIGRESGRSRGWIGDGARPQTFG